MAHPSDSLTPVEVGNLFGGLAAGTVAALVAVLPHALTGGASVPARDHVILLGTVLIVGILSGLAAMRATVTAPLVSAGHAGGQSFCDRPSLGILTKHSTGFAPPHWEVKGTP